MFDPGGVLHASLREALRRSSALRGEWSLRTLALLSAGWLGMISPPVRRPAVVGSFVI